MSNNTKVHAVTSVAEVKLPFRILRACKSSFEVVFEDGSRAFITNQALYLFMTNAVAHYTIVEHPSRGRIDHGPTYWVCVNTNVWTEGHMLMGKIFDANGMSI